MSISGRGWGTLVDVEPQVWALSNEASRELLAQKFSWSHFVHAWVLWLSVTVTSFAILGKMQIWFGVLEGKWCWSRDECNTQIVSNSFWKFLKRMKKGSSLGGDLHIDCAFPLNAYLSCHLGPDPHYENLVPGAPGGVVLAAECYMLPTPIWPFSSWPGVSGLIPSCLEFDLLWVLAWSPGSWPCSVEKVLSKFNFRDGGFV